MNKPEACLCNGFAGVSAAVIAGFPSLLADVSRIQEDIAWAGGMIVVIITSINGLIMIHNNLNKPKG